MRRFATPLGIQFNFANERPRLFHRTAPGSIHPTFCILQKQDILRAVLIFSLASIRYILNPWLAFNAINSDFAIYAEEVERGVKNDCLIRTLCGIAADVPGGFLYF